jgi:hypothetical protein
MSPIHNGEKSDAPHVREDEETTLPEVVLSQWEGNLARV